MIDHEALYQAVANNINVLVKQLGIDSSSFLVARIFSEDKFASLIYWDEVADESEIWCFGVSDTGRVWVSNGSNIEIQCGNCVMEGIEEVAQQGCVRLLSAPGFIGFHWKVPEHDPLQLELYGFRAANKRLAKIWRYNKHSRNWGMLNGNMVPSRSKAQSITELDVERWLKSEYAEILSRATAFA